jgi:hypothetical protein
VQYFSLKHGKSEEREKVKFLKFFSLLKQDAKNHIVFANGCRFEGTGKPQVCLNIYILFKSLVKKLVLKVFNSG